ncbi:hypothetical protein M501DRAFT_930057 [Patellaria atrata CBS 101060]|uniref:Myb-like domain-containing protein n=1 Tax=Patellaria atrata CBS 101060 TaxID=1346257 RepID=A0A9P4VPN4_9PEZI|nr:hypothetical protein M501DRAFT_930057 [Patellaria atrata CBS 101060]
MIQPLPSQNASPVSEYDGSSSSAIRARKMSSTGGNRSWSEEEENYLLQTRMQKMPYKHIAAHLKKTELACRLHYHQLSHGSHRRKRTTSVSSSVSSGSANASPHIPQYQLPHERAEYTPSESSRHASPLTYSPQVHYTATHSSPNRVQHKVLLPKPRPHTPGESPEPMNGLRINTAESVINPSPIDTNRLRAIYEARRADFWSSIAAEYGSHVSPAQLEDIWRRGNNIVRPLTPDHSPDGSITAHPVLKPSPFPQYSSSAVEPSTKSFSPINPIVSAVSVPDRVNYVLPAPTPNPQLSRTSTWSSTSSVPATSISALLTEDKSPRPEYNPDVVMRDGYHH